MPWPLGLAYPAIFREKDSPTKGARIPLSSTLHGSKAISGSDHWGGGIPQSQIHYEGDTPTFLYFIQNGLGSPEHPEYGSWGGRYTPIDARFAANHFADAADRVVGIYGRTEFVSNRATIWR